MFCTGDGLRAAGGRGRGYPALKDEFIRFRVEGDDLVDAAPIPIARTSLQTPKLSTASGHGVPRPGLWDGRERGDNEVGEETLSFIFLGGNRVWVNYVKKNICSTRHYNHRSRTLQTSSPQNIICLDSRWNRHEVPPPPLC